VARLELKSEKPYRSFSYFKLKTAGDEANEASREDDVADELI